MNINRERGARKKKIPCLKKKIRSTTFLSENLQEDVAVSLEENVLAVSFWMLQTSGKASTESTGLKELPERLSCSIGHQSATDSSTDFFNSVLESCTFGYS